MYIQNRKFHLSFILLAAILLSLFASACVDINGFLPEKVTQVVNISIPEEMLDHSSPTFKVNNRNFWEPLLDHVSRMELHDGYLRFFGTRNLHDGNVVPGSVDLYLGAEGGILVARIIALDIPGITLNDPRVIEINHEMRVGFRHGSISHDADLLFQEVQVTEEELNIKVQMTVRF